MQSLKRIAFGAAALLLVGAGCAGTAPINETDQAAAPDEGDAMMEEKESVKVGVMAPLTGDAATYGTAVRQGIELAVEDLGLDHVELFFEDTKCEGRDAATAASKLINIDGVSAIIGELCSSASLAAAPIAQEAGVVMISPASTAPAFSDAGDHIFRTVPSDALQGAFGAQLVYEKEMRKLAVLYVNDDYGNGFNDVLTERFPELGGALISSEAVERMATDVRAQLTKIKDTNPDALYIISNSPDTAAAALKQVAELGIEAQIFGSEGLKSDDLLSVVGEQANGLIITAVSGGNQTFVDRHMEKFNTKPGPFAAQAYDAMKALSEAWFVGGDTHEALADLSFAGASGNISFDENGDISGNYEVFIVEDGAFVLQ